MACSLNEQKKEQMFYKLLIIIRIKRLYESCAEREQWTRPNEYRIFQSYYKGWFERSLRFQPFVSCYDE